MSQKASLRYEVFGSFVTRGPLGSLHRRGSLPPHLSFIPEDPITALRITPFELWSRLQAQPPPLLVCAYDDEEKCASIKIPCSLTLQALTSRLDTLPRSQELVFYCS